MLAVASLNHLKIQVSKSNRKRVYLEDKPPRSRVYLYDEPLPAPIRQLPTQRKPLNGELTAIEMRYCHLITSGDITPTKAAVAAGFNQATAHVRARRLQADPRIRRQVKIIEADHLRRLRFDGYKFLGQQIEIAEADIAKELVEVWVPPCRYCYGRNYEYQRTHGEFQEAWEAWMRLPDKRKRGWSNVADLGYGEVLVYDDFDAKIPFDEKGGDGYDVEQPPNPACPNCHGRGMEYPGRGSVMHVKIKDTRDLSPTGRLLYAGVKEGAKGRMELIISNRDAARAQLTALLSKFLDLHASGKFQFGLGVNGSVADILTDDPRNYTDQQLDTMLASYLGSAGIDIEEIDASASEGLVNGRKI